MAEPLTNIGTSRPPQRATTESPQRVLPLGRPVADLQGRFRRGGAPEALPIAAREGEESQQVVAADPLWISRWQPSKTPMNRPRPWVKGYRFWHRDVAYQSTGVIGFWRVDMMFQSGHQHWYYLPESLWRTARELQTSVGEWLHANVLKPKSMLADGPL